MNEEKHTAGESFRFQVNLGGMLDILSNHLYKSPDVFLRELLQEKMGVDVSCADFQDLENVMQNIRANTAILYTETPSNPSLGLVNIRETARVARKTTAS